MSVERQDFIIYGWKLPYDIIDTSEDRYSQYIDESEPGKYAIISDDMTGDYMVFGVIVNRGDSNFGDWDFVEIKEYSNIEVLDEFTKVFPELKIPGQPKMFIFTHNY